MKTQILILTLALTLVFSLWSKAANTENFSSESLNELNIDYLQNDNPFDEDLIVEDWMINDEFWSQEIKNNIILEQVEAEGDIKVEPWMCNNDLFRIQLQFDQANDDVVHLRDWMTNDVYWHF